MDAMSFLKKYVKPATGCTEPIAVGYATSLAYYAIFNDIIIVDENDNFIFKNLPSEIEIDKIKQISIKTDQNVFKNAYSNIIPGTNGQKGMAIASAMGIFSDPRKKLNLFDGISSESIQKAKQILKSNKIIIKKIEWSDKPDLDIQVSVEYQVNSNIKTAYVRVQKDHDNVTEIRVNGKILFEGSWKKEVEDEEKFPEKIEELFKVARSITSEEIEEVYRGIIMNKKVVDEGMNGDYGLKVGRTLQKIAREEGYEESLIAQMRIKVASAGDARMGGASIPVMTTSGSGNLGIMAIIPITVMGEMKNIDRDKICEAILFSHFITKLADISCGHLSALCGCAIKAGIGVTAGIIYLLGGSLEQIHAAINLMAANNTGFICDGAKESCALKLSTAAGTATECALMALNGMKVSPDNGIIFENAEETIKAIGQISHSMASTDVEILKIIQNKNS